MKPYLDYSIIERKISAPLSPSLIDGKPYSIARECIDFAFFFFLRWLLSQMDGFVELSLDGLDLA
jgi:hypothetical protein